MIEPCLRSRAAYRCGRYLAVLLATCVFVSGCRTGSSSRPRPVSATGEVSVRPGVNEGYQDVEVGEWVARFETESREIYAHRHQIVKDSGIRPGMTVADVGAGTGLFVPHFARAVGPDGKVIAVDIVPEFIEHIRERALEDGLPNVETVLCADDDVRLAAESVDLVFICDTYHHFEFPRSTMTSIYEALKPDGQLVVIDFKRIPGESRAWVLNHVRAGEETVRAEIMSVGFVPAQPQPDASYLEENYLIRFLKPAP